MSKRKGKTKWLSPAAQAEADAARSAVASAVVSQLSAVYSELFDDSVIRLIAQQSDFDVDTAVAALSAMVDDPQLVAAARRRAAADVHNADSAAQSASAKSPSTASAGVWRSQPTLLASASATSSSTAPRRPQPSPQPIRQPQSTLASWPSPAEAQSAPGHSQAKQGAGAASRSSKAADGSSRLTRGEAEHRLAPASPASVRSLSPTLSPAILAIRSAPTSPSSAALQPGPLERATSATSAHSLSPTSPLASSSSLSVPVQREAPSPSATLPHPPVRIALGNSAEFPFDTRHSRIAAAAADDPPQWTTYSASEEDPLYYLMIVREQQDKLRREAEEKRKAEVVEDEELPAESPLDSFPSLTLQSRNPRSPHAAQKVTVNAAELLELLRTMFEGVDDALIHSVVASLDCLSVDLDQLNECVTTLTGIASDEQPGAEAEHGDDASEGGRSRENHGKLSDLDIAKQMAADPRFSPPRASIPRSLLQPPSTSSSSPSSPGARNGKPRASKVKVDLTKPVYRWAPPTPTDALVSPHLSAKWSLAALYKSFPRIDRPIIDDCFAGHGHHLQRTKEHLLSIFPDEMVGGDVAPLPTVLKVEERARRAGEPPLPRPKRDDAADEDADEGVGLIADAVLERDLGPVLDNHSIPFISASSSSPMPSSSPSTHANRRAAYFRAATEAFLAGRGGLAREYARRGREEGEMMVESGVRDAVRVFREANRDVDCYKRVDLHGQRVAEALCIVDFVVRRLRRRGAGELVVVTGRGRNSVGGRSRLKPAVISYCQRRGFKYSQANDAEVKMSWR